MKAFTHVALNVKDVRQSEQFYHDWCGMEVVRRHNDVAWMRTPGENFVIVLVPGLKNKFNGRANISHIGISVDSHDELVKLEKRAKREGRLHWPLQKHDYPVGELFSVRDPDGYVVEFSTGQPLGPDKQGPKP